MVVAVNLLVAMGLHCCRSVGIFFNLNGRDFLFLPVGEFSG